MRLEGASRRTGEEGGVDEKQGMARAEELGCVARR